MHSTSTLTPETEPAEPSASPRSKLSSERSAYFREAARKTLEIAEKVGIDYAIERAITEHYYDGLRDGIKQLAALQAQKWTRS